MNFFNDFIKVDLKKNMGLYNLTDEFFCVYLNLVRLKNNNILVVVDTIFKLISYIIIYLYCVMMFIYFQWMIF